MSEDGVFAADEGEHFEDGFWIHFCVAVFVDFCEYVFDEIFVDA